MAHTRRLYAKVWPRHKSSFYPAEQFLFLYMKCIILTMNLIHLKSIFCFPLLFYVYGNSFPQQQKNEHHHPRNPACQPIGRPQSQHAHRTLTNGDLPYSVEDEEQVSIATGKSYVYSGNRDVDLFFHLFTVILLLLLFI